MAEFRNTRGERKEGDLLYWPISLSTENIEEGTKCLLSFLEPNSCDYIQCLVFHGAYTNVVFKATSKQTSYVIRIYGAETSLFVNREEEIYHNALFHRLGLGPQILCAFQNGLCTEFLDGTALTHERKRNILIAKNVARKMAELHVKGDLLLKDLCEDRVPLLKSRFLNSWLSLIPDALSTVEETKRLEEIKMEFGPFPEVAARMLELVEQLNSPVLLCHNDLCCGNILQNEEGQIWFVDMEYAGTNYRGFDIAQYFSEFAGVEEPDYSLFPNKDFQLKWLREYLEEVAHLKGSSRIVEQEDVDRLYTEVKCFVPACHLVWGIWSLFQAQFSKINYDYLTYARQRFTQYRENLPLLQTKEDHQYF